MQPSTWIDFADPAGADRPRLRHAWGAPRAVLVARSRAEVPAVLDAVERAATAGAWCVGGLRYEAAAAFDPALATHAAEGPLAWFAVHDAPESDAAVPSDAGDDWAVDWQPFADRARFDADLRRIHAAIAAGECYQVNHTVRWRGQLQGSVSALWAALRRAQPGGYALRLALGPEGGDEHLLSVSPELFFDWCDGRLLTRPMKGTAARGLTPTEDAARAQALRSSPKERAENVMIVDLLRNDVSRIAVPHSVQVPALFHTEPLPTVWQMTSDVVAQTRPGTTLAQVFAALFPCGSVTGAPKVRAMQQIRALEPDARGWYCGALGVVRPAPGGGVHATFNVPIRTLVLGAAAASGMRSVVCGIGSGITSGAEADAEWTEWQHKRAFVERASAPFELLETLALVDGHLRHADAHLARMAEAAAHFGYPWQPEAVQAALQHLVAAHPAGAWRVRLRLNAQGQVHTEAFALAATAAPVRLQLARRPFEAAHSEFVRHKTTRRAHYAAFAPSTPGVFDTVLWNTAGEITETTFGNIAARLDSRWITPPLTCGLLPGVGRAQALDQGRVHEAVLRVQDVPRVEAWAFVNSLRGWLDATLEPLAAQP
ncbi:MAG: chorismate-binding protein [Burkholderiaceae bacterium]